MQTYNNYLFHSIDLAYDHPPHRVTSSQNYSVIYLHVSLKHEGKLHCRITSDDWRKYAAKWVPLWFVYLIDVHWQVQHYYIIEQCMAYSRPQDVHPQDISTTFQIYRCYFSLCFHGLTWISQCNSSKNFPVGGFKRQKRLQMKRKWLQQQHIRAYCT